VVTCDVAHESLDPKWSCYEQSVVAYELLRSLVGVHSGMPYPCLDTLTPAEEVANEAFESPVEKQRLRDASAEFHRSGDASLFNKAITRAR